MTDITELAQREKFEAWVMTQIYISKSTLEGLRTADGYRNSTLSGRDYNLMWNCWKAANAELVEALEKAQQHIARQEQILLNQDESLSIRRGELEAAQQERDNWRTSFDNERFRADKLKAHIDDMEPIRTAAEKLVRCKGRYHSEPVCFVSERNLATLTKYRAAVKVKAEPVMVRPVALYRHAQPPVTDKQPAPVVPVNDVTNGKPLTINLPDTSSKAFWSGSGKAEVFHPETYKRWVKEAIERYCAIARIDVEVK